MDKEKRNLKLSIIVPVYNMASDNKLTYCLDSLVAQNLSDYEIIAVDDASTDSSFEIMKDYQDRYPDIFKAIHSDVNKHQGGAKNIGIKQAKGEWIGFIDADDWIDPNMYKKLIEKAEETGAEVVGCDYVLVNEHTYEVNGPVEANSRDDQVGVLDHDKKCSLILDGGSLCVKIFKRQAILDNSLWFPEDIFYEDNAMSDGYLLTAARFEYIKEPLYYYYQHDTSTVHSFSERRCEDRMVSGRIMIDEAKRLGFYDEFLTELEFKFTQLFYINTLFTYMPCVKPARIGFVKNLSKEMHECFPDFQDNAYYQKRVNAEEKKLISMAQRSTLLFYVYYRLLWGYRNLKKRSKNK
ncbi:MAG: glycosyltransferase [Lachnospiraceae bacterium]|nr:glycosyltransferase [Lachnospiraceae bacterium]